MRERLVELSRVVLGCFSCSQPAADFGEGPVTDAGTEACNSDGGTLAVGGTGSGAFVNLELRSGCPLRVSFTGPSLWRLPSGVLASAATSCAGGWVITPDAGQVLSDGGSFSGLESFVTAFASREDGGFGETTVELRGSGSVTLSGIGYTLRSTPTVALTSGLEVREWAPATNQLEYTLEATSGAVDVSVEAPERPFSVLVTGPGGAVERLDSDTGGVVNKAMTLSQSGTVRIAVTLTPVCSGASSSAPNFESLPAAYREPVRVRATQR
jgi:hypothetical protein